MEIFDLNDLMVVVLRESTSDNFVETLENFVERFQPSDTKMKIGELAQTGIDIIVERI
jgi:hypothetical protein